MHQCCQHKGESTSSLKAKDPLEDPAFLFHIREDSNFKTQPRDVSRFILSSVYPVFPNLEGKFLNNILKWATTLSLAFIRFISQICTAF